MLGDKSSAQRQRTVSLNDRTRTENFVEWVYIFSSFAGIRFESQFSHINTRKSGKCSILCNAR